MSTLIEPPNPNLTRIHRVEEITILQLRCVIIKSVSVVLVCDLQIIPDEIILWVYLTKQDFSRDSNFITHQFTLKHNPIIAVLKQLLSPYIMTITS